MKRILISLLTIAIVGVVGVAATRAFFDDKETSKGNTLTAGAIDLKIDNTSYVTNKAGVMVASPNNTWTLNDLTNQLFFSFADLKPGDVGEDTISLHVTDNDAYACMNIKITSTPENDANEAEVSAGDSASDTKGELQNELNFAFWNDDGDNVYEVGETIFKQGLAKDLFDGKYLTLADSQMNIWTRTAGSIVAGENNYNIGKVWCYGALTQTPVAASSGQNPTVATGFTCNGAQVTNLSQTDGIVADVNFYAVQSRNNAGFTCDSMNPKFVLTDASEQNALNAVSQDKPWYTYEIDGLCVDFTLHNPNYTPAWWDFAIDNDPGSFISGLSNIVITQGPFTGQPVGNLYSDVKVDPYQTETITKCGSSEIKTAIHFGPEQEWYLDWATFTAQ